MGMKAKEISRIDAAQIYAQTLTELGDTLVKMTSPEWDSQLQNATPKQRQQAAILMIKTQHARLALGNAVLQEVADQLKQNENELISGINDLKGLLETLTKVTQILDSLTSFLNAIAKVVTLA